jgi:hypothetical protein
MVDVGKVASECSIVGRSAGGTISAISRRRKSG